MHADRLLGAIERILTQTLSAVAEALRVCVIGAAGAGAGIGSRQDGGSSARLRDRGGAHRTSGRRPVSSLEYCILGPFEVRRDGEIVELGPPRQRALLVALLLRANEVVSTDQLIDALWGESPPASARHSLHVYVANLRKILDPHTLVTRPPGYSLVIEPGALDAHRFEVAVAHARRLLPSDPTAAIAELRRADAGWTGEPFADFTYEPMVADTIAALIELRIGATEDRIDAQLAVGLHLELVGELERLAKTHPFRERVWGQWILALYRSGRQAEALRAYATLRTTLRDELGVEPSRALRDLEAAVLDQDPRLDLVTEDGPRASSAPPTEPEPVPPAEPARAAAASASHPLHRPRWLGVAAAAALIALVATGDALPLPAASLQTTTVDAAPNYTPRFTSIDCSADVRASVPDATCGTLSVPEDRSHPDHRWIDLAVTRAPARTGQPTDDPSVLVNDGLNPLETQATTPTRDHSDLITFPTRQSYAPNPAMECPEYAAVASKRLVSPEHDPALLEEEQAADRRCIQRLASEGVALDHYTADDAAEDVADLARALGIRQMNLISEADSSVVTFQVIRHHRDIVRTLTLQNPVAPGRAEQNSDPTAELARAFDAYIKLCQADARCNHAYPDLAQDSRTDWRQAVDHPTVVTGTNPVGQRADILLDGDRLPEAIAEGLASRSALPYLAALIGAGRTNSSAAPTSDEQSNALAANGALSFEWWWADPQVPAASMYANWCGYEARAVQPFHLVSDNAQPELAGVDSGVLAQRCGDWPVPRAPDDEFSPLVTDVPTLIVDGELDAWSSPEWADMLRNGLSHSTFMLFPTLGSGPLGEGIPVCIDDLRRQFLTDPSSHLDADGCVAQSPPIDFVVNTP
jgi:DNA-binding SARP family transcriptional activator/pimeloyl-ACP methyl ester carboxylesterase